ncbi:MAG: carbohydrate ABC transporter permease [Actinomycetota bacterium]|nr:carbohydrate ABC transporter permease [Actinomycetota bacterium]
MTVLAVPPDTPQAGAVGAGAPIPPPQRRRERAGIGAHLVIIVLAILWMIPLVWTLYTSLRPESDTNKYGYFSLAHSLTLRNYSDAWSQGQLAHFFWNSIKITVPAVIITLFFASCVAFVVSRFSNRLNLIMLLLFTAGNLLPQQVLLSPLFKIFINVHVPNFISDSGELYDSTFGLVVINVAFQTGFCVFVLSNFMRTIPEEITEAALVDGASIWTQYWRITLPLCRPALAALATLLTTWIYNDFFWALTLMSTGSKLPITSAIKNLAGEFAQNNNLLAAGALIIAVPTLIVYVALQRQFIAGLTLGSTKG